MQPISPSLHSKLMDLYKGRIKEDPVQIPYARVSYIDLNQNGKRDLGEELVYNQKAEQLLKHIVFRENDLLQLEKVSDLIFSENKKTQDFLNQMEAYLVARRALLVSNVDSKKIPDYFYKLEDFYYSYLKYLQENKLKPNALKQNLIYIHQYLWGNGGNRSEETIHRFDVVIDNQLRYFKDHRVKVGNCSGLAALHTVLALRRGIPVKFVTINDISIIRNGKKDLTNHIFSQFEDIIVEHTNFSGTNTHQFSTKQIHSVNALILGLAKNTWQEYKKLNNKSMEIQFLQKSVLLDPEDIDLYNELATAYLHNGKTEDAIFWYQKGIIVNPLNDNILHNLGVSYILKKDFVGAIKYIKFAIQVNSKEAVFYSNLGFAYENINKFQEAYDNYREALKLNPKLDTAINNMNRLKQKVKIVSRK